MFIAIFKIIIGCLDGLLGLLLYYNATIRNKKSEKQISQGVAFLMLATIVAICV